MAITVTLKPLTHRGKEQIAIFFDYNKELKKILLDLGAKWTKTHGCFYLESTTKNKQKLYVKLRKMNYYIDYSAMPKKKRKPKTPSIEASISEEALGILKKYENYLIGQRKSKSTVNTYSNFIKLFLIYFRDRTLSSLEYRDIEIFIEDVIAKRKYSISSHRQCVSAIKHLDQLDLKLNFDAAKLMRPKKDKKLPVILSSGEVLQLLQVTKNLKHRAIIAFIYSTGLRISELLNLKISAIDLERNVIHIKQSKGRKDRIVPIGKQVKPLLLNYAKTYRPEVYLFEGEKEGKPYSASSVRQFLKRNCKAANIRKRITPHSLRHSYATHLLENGVDIRYIQEFLGHAKPETTMIYTHVSQKKLEAITNPLDAAIAKELNTNVSDKDDNNIFLSR